MDVRSMPPAADMEKAVVVCEDCQQEIKLVFKHFQTYPMNLSFSLPLNKQFEGHIDHNISIMIPLQKIEIKNECNTSSS